MALLQSSKCGFNLFIETNRPGDFRTPSILYPLLLPSQMSNIPGIVVIQEGQETFRNPLTFDQMGFTGKEFLDFFVPWKEIVLHPKEHRLMFLLGKHFILWWILRPAQSSSEVLK